MLVELQRCAWSGRRWRAVNGSQFTPIANRLGATVRICRLPLIAIEYLSKYLIIDTIKTMLFNHITKFGRSEIALEQFRK